MIRSYRPFLTSLLGLALASTVRSSTLQWTGNASDANWTSAANWTTGMGTAVPANNGTAELIFGTSNRYATSINGSWDILKLQFLPSVAVDYSLQMGNSVLTLGQGGIQSLRGNHRLLGGSVLLVANQSWNVASGSIFVSALNTTSSSLTLGGAGSVIVDSLDGNGQIVVGDSTTLSAFDVTEGLFTGTVRVAGGTLNPLGGALRSASVILDSDDGLAGAKTIEVGSLSGQGLVRLGGSILEVGYNGEDSTFRGAFLPDQSGAIGLLSKTGNGTLTLTGGTSLAPNSLLYLNVFQGRLVLDGNVTSVGQNNILEPGGVLMNAAGTLELRNGARLSLNGTSITGGQLVVENGSIENGTLGTNLVLDKGQTLGLTNVAIAAGKNLQGDGILNTNLLFVDGTLHVTSTGQVLNGGTSLYVRSGGAMTVDAGGTVNLGGTSLEVDGLLRNAGTIGNGLLSINQGGVLIGGGELTDGYILVGGGTLTFDPSTPGVLRSGDAFWDGGGSLSFPILSASGTPGSDWGLNEIDGTLSLFPGDSGETFVVRPFAGGAGAFQDFDASRAYSWTFATATGGIVGFKPTFFTVDSTLLPGIGGAFQVVQIGNSLALAYSPKAVPEPASMAALGLGALCVLKRRKKA